MSKLLLLAILVGAGTFAAGATASAEEPPSRVEYVSRLEGICKPGAESTEQTMQGVRKDIRARRYKVAAAKFGRAARIFRRTLGSIKAVPRPPADKPTLARWFRYLGKQRGYLDRIPGRLRVGDTARTQRLTGRFIHTGNLANNVVLAFGFNYCRFKFSRYS